MCDLSRKYLIPAGAEINIDGVSISATSDLVVTFSEEMLDFIEEQRKKVYSSIEPNLVGLESQWLIILINPRVLLNIH